MNGIFKTAFVSYPLNQPHSIIIWTYTFPPPAPCSFNQLRMRVEENCTPINASRCRFRSLFGHPIKHVVKHEMFISSEERIYIFSNHLCAKFQAKNMLYSEDIFVMNYCNCVSKCIQHYQFTTYSFTSLVWSNILQRK